MKTLIFSFISYILKSGADVGESPRRPRFTLVVALACALLAGQFPHTSYSSQNLNHIYNLAFLALVIASGLVITGDSGRGQHGTPSYSWIETLRIRFTRGQSSTLLPLPVLSPVIPTVAAPLAVTPPDYPPPSYHDTQNGRRIYLSHHRAQVLGDIAVLTPEEMRQPSRI